MFVKAMSQNVIRGLGQFDSLNGTGHHRSRAQRQQYLLSLKYLTGRKFQCFFAGESRCCVVIGDLVGLNQHPDAFIQFVHQLIFASNHFIQKELDITLHAKSPGTHPREQSRGFQKRLGRDAPAVQTGTTQFIRFHQSDIHSVTCRADSRRVSGRATAHNNQFFLNHFHIEKSVLGAASVRCRRFLPDSKRKPFLLTVGMYF